MLHFCVLRYSRMNKISLDLDLKRVSCLRRETIFITQIPTATSIRPGCQLYAFLQSIYVVQISLKHTIALPNTLVYQKSDVTCSSGLFPEVDTVWYVKGNTIHLWNYKLKGSLSFPNEITQQITHVLLAKAMQNVFENSVTVFFGGGELMIGSMCW